MAVATICDNVALAQSQEKVRVVEMERTWYAVNHSPRTVRMYIKEENKWLSSYSNREMVLRSKEVRRISSLRADGVISYSLVKFENVVPKPVRVVNYEAKKSTIESVVGWAFILVFVSGIAFPVVVLIIAVLRPSLLKPKNGILYGSSQRRLGKPDYLQDDNWDQLPDPPPDERHGSSIPPSA